MSPINCLLVNLLILSVIQTVVPQSEPVEGSVRPYDIVQINDPSEKSAGIYFRISQMGVDYLAGLMSEGLPLIFHRMVLPTISESGFTINDAVITRITRPAISVKFVEGQGIDISIKLPEFEIRGDATMDVFIASYKSQIIAVSNDMTVKMSVNIHRSLNESVTNVNVTECSVDPGPIKLNYYGADSTEFYAVGSIVQPSIENAIRDKICVLPPLVTEFLHEKIDLLLKPPKDTINQNIPPSDKSTETSSDKSSEGSTILDHLCGQSESSFLKPEPTLKSSEEEDETNEPDVNLGRPAGKWMPDLTLRYPPTFSNTDLIFGLDGGVLVDGQPASDVQIERPRLDNLSVLRDQMLGLIVSDYVPNTLFQQLFDREIGSVSVIYSIKHIPGIFQPLAKLLCPDCKLLIRANLTQVPHATVTKNGVHLNLQGDVSAMFFRKNATQNVLSANGVLRVNIKPHFRQSRLFSDVMLAGVDFKVYKAGISGLLAGGVRKLVAFMIPRAIWPKIQQRLRMAISYKGIQIPRLCTTELLNLHLDYMEHAAVLSTDFNVDLPLLVRSFKEFMDSKLQSKQKLSEHRGIFRYL